MDMESRNMDLRSLEKGSKFGFMFYISYDGKAFDTFDELKGKKSVKGEFAVLMNELGFTWAKGVQQAGRTDAKVSATENILYMSSNYREDVDRLIERFNSKSGKAMKIKGWRKTLPNLSFPEMIEERGYCYRYPVSKISREISEIERISEELSGTYDVSRFTDHKGKQLKERIRRVEVSYDDEGLHFRGSSFMPKQVRIMSAHILTDSMDPLPGKYLTLEKIILTSEMEGILIEAAPEVVEENLLYAEKTRDAYIFYVDRKKKGEFIGSRGKNIKKLRKKYGNIIVREMTI